MVEYPLCLVCNKILTHKHKVNFCSLRCKRRYGIENWLKPVNVDDGLVEYKGNSYKHRLQNKVVAIRLKINVEVDYLEKLLQKEKVLVERLELVKELGVNN